MVDKIAISEHQALRNMWYTGFDTEPKLKAAHNRLQKLTQPTLGYYYPDDVTELICKMQQEEQ